MRKLVLAAAAVGLLASPAAQAQTKDPCTPTAHDQDRLARLGAAWREALADARRAGYADQIRRQGALLQPNVGRGLPQPTPGVYRCRTIKLGDGAGLPFVAYPYFRCQVTLSAGGDLRIEKLTGSQRLSGVCPMTGPDARRQARFVGVLGLGDERTLPLYGEDRSRDVVGLVERLGPDRWRIAQPWPAAESKLDILELVRTGNLGGR